MQLKVLPFELGLLCIDFLFTVLQLIYALDIAVPQLHILDAQSIDGFVAFFVLVQYLPVLPIYLFDFAFHLICFGFKVQCIHFVFLHLRGLCQSGLLALNDLFFQLTLLCQHRIQTLHNDIVLFPQQVNSMVEVVLLLSKV